MNEIGNIGLQKLVITITMGFFDVLSLSPRVLLVMVIVVHVIVLIQE